MIYAPALTAARRAAAATLVGLSISLLAVTGAPAQQQQQQPDPTQFGPRVNRNAQGQGQATQPEVVGTHGNWQVQCGEFMASAHQSEDAAGGGQGAEDTEGAEGAEGAEGKSDQQDAQAGDGETKKIRQCGMLQTVRSDERQNVGLTLVLVNTKQGDREVTMMRILVPVGVFLPTGIALEIDGAAVGRVPFTRCLPQVCMAFAEATPETLDKMRKGTTANFIIYEAPGMGLGLNVSLKGFTAAYDQLTAM